MTVILIVASIGAILGIILGIASEKLKVEVDPRIETVIEMLPGFNCGACGFPGCAGLAEGTVNEGASPRLCKPASQETVDKIVAFLKESKEA